MFLVGIVAHTLVVDVVTLEVTTDAHIQCYLRIVWVKKSYRLVKDSYQPLYFYM